MAENEELVSRRQLFRGLAGGLLRTIGDLTEAVPADRASVEAEARPVAAQQADDGAGLIDPERQAATLKELFDFLDNPPNLGSEPR